MIRELTIRDIQSMAPGLNESDAVRVLRSLLGAHPREMSGEEWVALCDRVVAESGRKS